MNTSQKTLVFSNYDDIQNPYYGGGGAFAIHEVAKRLSHDYNIIVLTGNYPNSKDHNVDGVMYKRIGVSTFHPKINQLIYQFLLPIFAKKLRYDIWLESFTPPFSTAFLPIFSSKPIVGITHFLSAAEKSREYKLPFAQIEKQGLKKYKYFVALTDEIRQKIKAVNPDSQVQVISNGTNIMRPKNIISKKSSKYIIFIGRLEVIQKGLDLLLKSFAIVAKKSGIELLICGNSDQRELQIINKLLNQLQIEDRVKLLGRVEGEKKNNLVQSAIATIIPSRFEGQSLVAIESMTLGTPVVVFDIPGFKWLDNNITVKAKPFSISDLANKILDLHQNHNLRRKLGKAGLQDSKKYDWDSISKQYDHFIKKILTRV